MANSMPDNMPNNMADSMPDNMPNEDKDNTSLLFSIYFPFVPDPDHDFVFVSGFVPALFPVLVS